jgi:hypothetical protein
MKRGSTNSFPSLSSHNATIGIPVLPNAWECGGAVRQEKWWQHSPGTGRGLPIRPPAKRREEKDPIQAEDRWKAGSLLSWQCTPPYSQKKPWKPSGNWNGTFWHIHCTVPIWPYVISTCSEGSNQTYKAYSLRMTRSSRLFGSVHTANHKPFLKRASGCFQNVRKNVVTLGGSMWKTDMCKCLAIMGIKKPSHGHIWTTLYKLKNTHKI